jgi:uncharacterized repeat protein (TIGR01451 family)
MVKTVTRAEAKVRDVLTYTVLVANTNDVEARNAVWTDILPPQVQFVPGSITVDGVPQPSADPVTGVNLGTIGLEGPIEITFQAKIVNVPDDEIIENRASLAYEFESAPGLPIANGNASSTVAQTKVVVRPPTPCERNQTLIEQSIQQEEQHIRSFQAVEQEKIRVANESLAAGEITSIEDDHLIYSGNSTLGALQNLQQELNNKRSSIADLCNGCK